jgi:hypothetical protein
MKTVNLDVRLILETAIRQFVPWLGGVLLVTWAGYPGVVCVTPMAWLIALQVGNVCATKSKSTISSNRLFEAALAGGLLGLLQGILFMVVVPAMGSIRPEEEANMGALTAIMVVAGVFIGAALSFFTAFLNEQRKKRALSQ